jgi:hypothetical protein
MDADSKVSGKTTIWRAMASTTGKMVDSTRVSTHKIKSMVTDIIVGLTVGVTKGTGGSGSNTDLENI